MNTKIISVTDVLGYIKEYSKHMFVEGLNFYYVFVYINYMMLNIGSIHTFDRTRKLSDTFVKLVYSNEYAGIHNGIQTDIFISFSEENIYTIIYDKLKIIDYKRLPDTFELQVMVEAFKIFDGIEDVQAYNILEISRLAIHNTELSVNMMRAFMNPAETHTLSVNARSDFAITNIQLHKAINHLVNILKTDVVNYRKHVSVVPTGDNMDHVDYSPVIATSRSLGLYGVSNLVRVDNRTSDDTAIYFMKVGDIDLSMKITSPQNVDIRVNPRNPVNPNIFEMVMLKKISDINEICGMIPSIYFQTFLTSSNYISTNYHVVKYPLTSTVIISERFDHSLTDIHISSSNMKCVLLDVFRMLVAINKHIPGWAHNDLHSGNILLSKRSDMGKCKEFTYKNEVYTVPAYPYKTVLWDFELSTTDNKKIVSGYENVQLFYHSSIEHDLKVLLSFLIKDNSLAKPYSGNQLRPFMIALSDILKTPQSGKSIHDFDYGYSDTSHILRFLER